MATRKLSGNMLQQTCRILFGIRQKKWGMGRQFEGFSYRISMSKKIFNVIVTTSIAASTLFSLVHAPQVAQATRTTNSVASVYGAYAKPAARRVAAPAAAPSNGPVLPIEVLTGDNPANTTLFPNGFFKTVTVTVANAANAKKFWMQVYSLSYQDKASVQINNSSWVTLNNTTTVVLQPGQRYGGIGGANRTLKLTFDVPPGVVVNGDNVIRFKFNKTDGESMGFRVLNFNFWDAGNAPMLSNPPIAQEDPNTWTPPISSGVAISEGQVLWHSRNIMTNNPLDPSPFKASCADCHSQSGYDLKFFNFSNTSVIERSRFHGLSQTQGEKIASFIRTLSFENPGRPWNPPYQPGPGLEAKPVDEWAAGAGIDAVLEKDTDVMAFLPSNGANPDSFIDGARVKKFNVRDMPISIELPDWNHWLPRVHPIDSMGVITFEQSANFLYYDKIRKGLAGTLPGLTHDEYVQKQLRQDLDDWGYWFAPDSKSPEFAALGPSGNNPFTKKQVVEQYAAAIWSASKLFEIMHEFELEELGRQFYGLQGESRQWLSNRHIFNFSPHLLGMSHAFPVTGDGRAELTNLYFANVWYWLQIILNPGARNSMTGGWAANDWDYTSTIMTNLAQESSGKEPLRSLLLAYKGMDNGDDGYGPNGRDKGGVNGAWWGWDMRDNTAQLVGYWQQGWWDGVSNKAPALTAAYQTWLEKSGSFNVEQWRKLAATREAPDWALNLSSPPYTFVIPNFAQNSDLENAATMLAYHTRLVRDANEMDDAIPNAMADLGSLLWPSNPWNTLITRSGAAPSNLQATAGVEQVALSWNAVGGASSYNVKHSDFVTGTYVAVGLFVNSTSFVDKDLQAGRSYHYQVSANMGSSETNNSASASATPTFGLVGYWPLDGGTSVQDASTTMNQSVLVGSISSTVGHRSNAIKLGPQTFVATERNLRWLSGDFSFAAWISTTASGNNNLTLAPALAGNVGEGEDNPFDPLKTQVDRRYDKTGNRFAIVGGLDSSGKIGASFGTDTSAIVKSTQSINNGAWRHVVVSRDSASGLVKVYVDGALSASGTLTTGYLYQRAFGIGRPENGQLANYFPGTLDEVRIYDRPLTDGEVLALYSDTVGEPAAITSGSPTTATYGTPYAFSITTVGSPTPTLTLSGTLPAGLSFITTTNGTASLSGTPTAAGSATITVTASNGIGSPNQQQYMLVVSKAPLTVTAPTYSRNYGMPTPPLQPSYNGYVNGDNASSLGGSANLAFTPTTTTPAGVYAIVATTGTLSNNNYVYTFVNGTLTIIGTPSTYMGGAPPSGTYGSTYFFSMTATGDPAPSVAVMGLPAGLLSINSTITGTPTVAGSFLITMSTYNGIGNADTDTYTLVISKAPLTVTAENKARPYGEANPAFTSTYAGFVNGDDAGDLNGAPSLTTTANAASAPSLYPIVASTGTLSANNYAFAFVNGTLMVTSTQVLILSGAPTAAMYGNAYTFEVVATGSPTPTMSVSGLPTGLSYSGGTITGTPTAAGSSLITATADNGTTSDQKTYTLVVSKATLTVTADDKARPYGEANPIFTTSLTGFVNGDGLGAVSGAASLTTMATASSPPGMYPIVASLSTLNAANYAFAFVNGTLMVTSTNVVILSGPPAAGTYGSAYVSNVTATGSPAPTVNVSGLPAGLSFASGKITGTPLAAGSSVVTVTASNGYTSDTKVYALAINKAALNVVANSLSRLINTPNPALTVSYTGFVNGDNASDLSGAPSVTTTATTNSVPGSYPIVASQGMLASANYSFAFANGTLAVVSEAPVLPEDNPPAGMYGTPYSYTFAVGGNPTATVTITGELPPGMRFANNMLSGTPNKPGTYVYTVTASNDGSGENSPSVPGVSVAHSYTIIISKAILTVRANSLTRAEGVANPTLTMVYVGFVPGDTTENRLTGSPVLTTVATTTSVPDVYPIQVGLGTLASEYYDFRALNGTLTVTAMGIRPRAFLPYVVK